MLPTTLALMVVYPEHQWEKAKFKGPSVETGHWKDPLHQRNFFDNFSKQMSIQFC